MKYILFIAISILAQTWVLSQACYMDAAWGTPPDKWKYLHYQSLEDDGSVIFYTDPLPTDEPESTKFMTFKQNELVEVSIIHDGTYRFPKLYKQVVETFGQPVVNEPLVNGTTKFHWFVGNTQIAIGSWGDRVMLQYQPIEMPRP